MIRVMVPAALSKRTQSPVRQLQSLLPAAIRTAFLVILVPGLPSALRAQQKTASVAVSEVLDADALQGNGYTIADVTEVHDNRYLFQVSTDYGGFSALGLPMLELRLREHHAIQNALALTDDPLILKGIVEIAKETPDGAKSLLKDPLGSLIRVPSRLKKTIDTVVDPLERRAGSPVRRQVAVSIGADPETRNQILSRLLSRIAIQKNVGRLAAQAGLSFAVPGLGLLAINKEIKHEILTKGPRQIATEVETRLIDLKVRPEISEAFAKGRHLTSTEKLLFVVDLETLAGVTGLAELVVRATEITTEARLLSQFQQLQMLSNLHNDHSVVRIHSDELLIAEIQGGTSVVVLAVDLIERGDRIAGYVSQLRAARSAATIEVMVSGRLSEEVQADLARMKIGIRQFVVSSSADID